MTRWIDGKITIEVSIAVDDKVDISNKDEATVFMDSVRDAYITPKSHGVSILTKCIDNFEIINTEGF
jgi:hypothetical protein